jgi:uncharacterized damage-inducible protein DinB
MRMIDPMILELEHEAVSTRKCLERIPGNLFGWKPHPKSMSMGQLAAHIANTPTWGTTVLKTEELIFSSQEYMEEIPETTASLVALFDWNLAELLDRMKVCDNAHYADVWRMTMEGKVIIEMPRGAVLRVMILNHLVHHRGQLTVYMRENDLLLPAIYGPSADEKG